MLLMSFVTLPLILTNRWVLNITIEIIIFTVQSSSFFYAMKMKEVKTAGFNKNTMSLKVRIRTCYEVENQQ